MIWNDTALVRWQRGVQFALARRDAKDADGPCGERVQCFGDAARYGPRTPLQLADHRAAPVHQRPQFNLGEAKVLPQHNNFAAVQPCPFAFATGFLFKLSTYWTRSSRHDAGSWKVTFCTRQRCAVLALAQLLRSFSDASVDSGSPSIQNSIVRSAWRVAIERARFDRLVGVGPTFSVV